MTEDTKLYLKEDTCEFSKIRVGSFFLYKHSSGKDEICLKMNVFQYNDAPANAAAAESGEGYLFDDDYKVRPVKEAHFKC